ncbi:ABC transporter ATP-binding protein [Streptococcus sp. CCUG 49591]|uniref:ABC transporter ATP-binding protein n=1 Tax=Streptococcus sp. CCUG 49591 TaxID=1860161 RepID=UPI0007D8FBCE|nr:ABC transporter ATP-binding protein [Streptococcus sp. CCUG 49591]OAN12421.1 multidrug ABC transporter permease [Streptococcus sp. CCUG 49591]
MRRQTAKQTLKRLAKDLASHPFLLFLAFLGTIAQVGLSIYLPILIGQVIDQVLVAGSSPVFWQIFLQMLLVVIGNTLVQWANPLLYNHLIFSYTRDLRERIIHKLHRLPIAFVDRQGSGEMVSRVTTDIEQLAAGLTMIFNQFFIGVLMILVSILAMLQIHLLMTLLVLLLTPLSMVISRFIAKRSYHLFQKQTETRGIQTQLIEESLSQQTIIQSFNAQAEFIQRLREANDNYAGYSQSAIFYSSTVNPSTRFVNALIYALLAGVGAYRIMMGSILTIGRLVTFLNYVQQYTKPFNDISSVLAELQSALACAERVYGVLDSPEVAETGKEELTSDQVKGAISFKQVSFGYHPEKILIKDLSIDIPAGSKVAIVGPTGAGKSTLINLLMRFYPINSGDILLDGKSIYDYNRASLRQQFGMVLQETWLKQGTIHDNISFGNPKASREQVIAAAKAANADFFIQQLPQGYDTKLENAGESLSVGQAQLLTIARVFLAIPKILILDEATSSIDTRTEVLVQDAFAKLMKGRTSFIIAHRLSTIQDADLILVLVDGDIVEYGSHQELMARKGKYYQMQQAAAFSSE